jgi:hypothetical protein
MVPRLGADERWDFGNVNAVAIVRMTVPKAWIHFAVNLRTVSISICGFRRQGKEFTYFSRSDPHNWTICEVEMLDVSSPV